MEEGIFTNRELASLVLLGFLVVFVVAKMGPRWVIGTVRPILRILSTSVIGLLLVIYVVWMVGSVAVIDRLGLWDSSFRKPTIMWFVLAGLGLYFSLNDAVQKPGWFRRSLFVTLSVSAVIEFVATLQSFPFLVELVAQPIVSLMAITAVYARHQSEPQLARVADWIVGLFGTAALLWAAVHLIADRREAESGLLVKEFLLPVWLTIAGLVFIYLLALSSSYSVSFRIMRRQCPAPVLKPALAMISAAGPRLDIVRGLAGFRAKRVGDARSFKAARAEIRAIRQEEAERGEREEAAAQRLIDFAGVEGTDDAGRQLDRREFDETTKALQWASTCQMGQFRNKGQKYVKGIEEIATSGFRLHGLPEDHGVSSFVTRDRQAWYASRQTVSGWWFAIGATGPPPDTWFYDGPNPPEGPPVEEEWDQLLPGPRSSNWI